MSGTMSLAAFLTAVSMCGDHRPFLQEAEAHDQNLRRELVAIATQESGFDPLLIGVNADKGRSLPAETRRPRDIDDAEVQTRNLLAAGRSIDAGVMQINSANWSSHGLTPRTVFDAERNVCVGALIYAENREIERRALCRYNAGTPDCSGVYPANVQAIERRQAPLPPSPSVVAAPVPAQPDPCGPVPPMWDGWAQLAHEQCQRRASAAKPPVGTPRGAAAVASNAPVEVSQ